MFYYVSIKILSEEQGSSPICFSEILFGGVGQFAQLALLA